MFTLIIVIVFIPIGAAKHRGPGLTPTHVGGEWGTFVPPPTCVGVSPGPRCLAAPIGMNTMTMIRVEMNQCLINRF